MRRSTVVGVDRYETRPRGVTLCCRTDNQFVGSAFKYREGTERADNAVVRDRPVSLTFYNPSTFRFEFAANPEAGATEALNDLNESAITTDIDLGVTETDGTLVVESADLRVSIGLAAWSFSVERQDPP